MHHLQMHRYGSSWRLIAMVVGLNAILAIGQTNPSALTPPVSQNFGTATFTSLPTGFAAWNGLSGGTVNSLALAQTSSPTGNATIAAQTAATTTGGAFGLANGGNARFYVQTSSNATNGVNQLAMAINTVGATSGTLTYDVEVISIATRTVGVVCQYRVGTSGGWTTLTPATGSNPYSQVGGSTGLATSVSVNLPPAALNQPVVQVRWALWRGTETGNSGGLAIDNITVNTVAGGCGITLGAPFTTCDALTAGIDTYDLLIPYTGVSAGISVVNNGTSGTIAGDNPASQNNGTIIISNITEGDAYSVTFTSPCDALSVTGSSPSCVPPTCGIILGTPSTFCNANTLSVDTYDLSIPYTGVQAGVTVTNGSGSGTLGGDDPAVVANGTIVISGISEANNYNVTFSAPCGSLSASGNAPVCEPPAVLIINEVDYDQVGADNAEWVELYNAGTVPVNLAGYSILAVNGANGLVQSTANLSAVILAVGDYYVVGTATVPNVDQIVTGSDRIQNGGADAVILRDPSSAVVDAISYEGNSIAPYIEGTGLAGGDDGVIVTKVIARRPNGADSNDNSVDWAVWCATPGTSNDGAPDSDLDGVADCLDTCPLLVDGTANSNPTSCNCNVGFDPVFTTIGPNQVITACNVSACDIVLGSPVVTCNSFTIGTTDTYNVSIPYTGVEPGVTVTNNGASGAVGGDDPSTVTNGTITITNVSEADAFSISLTAPCGAQTASGAAPACEPTPSLVINEVDYDQPGTDGTEYIELKNTGNDPVNLNGLLIRLWNGTGNIQYGTTIVLSNVTLAAGDYYVLGSATVPNVDQVVFTTNGIQNGNPDGVRLTTAGGTIIDQMSYGGAIATTEGTSATTDLGGTTAIGVSLSRVPDGTDTNDNSVDFIRGCSTPGATNTQPDADNDGTPDCLDVCPGGPEPGTTCDDGQINTVDDVIQANCTCAGTLLDCEGIPGGPAGPGTTCDDLNPGTVNDVYQADCSCAGEIVDCLGIPGGPNLPGTACNDFIPSTNDETWQADCQCVGTPCSQNVVLELRSDANSDQIGWEILYQNDGTVVCSGGTQATAYPPGIVDPIVESCCLPIGCFRLRVLDSGGDGFVTGGYQLREQGVNGRRIIDNMPLDGNLNAVGNFSTGNLSALASTYDNGAFCVPIGNVKPIYSSCDKLDWVNFQFIVAEANAAVTAEFGLTNTTSGYDFWFYDPNGSYSYRRFRSHATSDGFGTGATRACHFKINGWINNGLNPHIPQNVLMNVRIRGRVNGVNQPFGPACLFKLNATQAACPVVKLQDNPANPSDFSCGVNRTFGGANSASNRIVANPPQFQPAVASSLVRYQFRFRIPGEIPQPGSCIVRPAQTSPTLHMNWAATSGPQLKCNTLYEVDVRVSKDGGATWCVDVASPACSGVGYTPWGKICTVNITTSTFCPPPPPLQGGSSSMAVQGNGAFTMYPNPNRGDQLFLHVSEVERDVNTVMVDIFDMTGKRVMARTIAVTDNMINTNMELNPGSGPGQALAGGLYLVNITAGTKTYTERLVIQP